ncbi:alpha-glucuronidase family glycosyl hydrolase [Bacillus sp. FJAT-26390]|uniref:alpha-glucuronidase family glycosyl hydrolase n=1 Tax=Bacillus sp. FJAT-26390 TaxID=1743142 RepID=UPI0008080B9F|nr:alpha-glucuronidase family glycosyl hydrolase [Bacillus sp. FJAT-26390]OBZ12218.1 alpha-glucuronidase [Bacillus sp. FJAT-26390]
MNSHAYKAWLNDSPLKNEQLKAEYSAIVEQIVYGGEPSGVLETAIKELLKGIQACLGITPTIQKKPDAGGCLQIIVISDGVQLEDWKLGKEGFALQYKQAADNGHLTLAAVSEAGILYGVFHLLRHIGAGKPVAELNAEESPSNQLRMINQWDNADGSIERGYAGRSIFYENGAITTDLQRIKDYARLLASVGLNAISINNVNVHEVETGFITEELLPSVAGIAGIFRDYGIRLFLSVNFAAPLQIGGLSTADPLDAGVQSWWKETAERIYSFIPDFGGFVVKADSEHRPGPFAYGRDHADGANMLADSLSAYDGIVIWRCFVYDCMQDWRDRKTDRARAAYDHFKPLDGRFRGNVLLQIKNGPMDFQVREPVSPLFGAMKKTNQMMEFQITQEYTGQQKHLCYLVPQWKQALDFDTYAEGAATEVKRIVDGSIFGMKQSGIAAVSNIGNDESWTGHILAQANLYGYGRLVWNPNLSAEEISIEWTIATFGVDPLVTSTMSGMLMKSWSIYESYTAPLGVGWMVAPNHHYGPDVDGYEYSRWGTYHFADRDGIGVDRTRASGTGYTAQYEEPNASLYDNLETCPDELLLFFHHVPYTHKLHSGKTVIQHIYDTHFWGVEEAEKLEREWAGLAGKIDEARFVPIANRLSDQAKHAKQWRDIINTYFFRKSGIPDALGRKIY